VIPPLLTVALLGRRVELDLGQPERGRVEQGVVVGLARGMLRLRTVSHRAPDGTWRGKGLSWTRPRAVIERITVIDTEPTP
jgi:hypothetical protein